MNINRGLEILACKKTVVLYATCLLGNLLDYLVIVPKQFTRRSDAFTYTKSDRSCLSGMQDVKVSELSAPECNSLALLNWVHTYISRSMKQKESERDI